jgi:hypothetical protein
MHHHACRYEHSSRAEHCQKKLGSLTPGVCVAAVCTFEWQSDVDEIAIDPDTLSLDGGAIKLFQNPFKQAPCRNTFDDGPCHYGADCDFYHNHDDLVLNKREDWIVSELRGSQDWEDDVEVMLQRLTLSDEDWLCSPVESGSELYSLSEQQSHLVYAARGVLFSRNLPTVERLWKDAIKIARDYGIESEPSVGYVIRVPHTEGYLGVIIELDALVIEGRKQLRLVQSTSIASQFVFMDGCVVRDHGDIQVGDIVMFNRAQHPYEWLSVGDEEPVRYSFAWQVRVRYRPEESDPEERPRFLEYIQEEEIKPINITELVLTGMEMDTSRPAPTAAQRELSLDGVAYDDHSMALGPVGADEQPAASVEQAPQSVGMQANRLYNEFESFVEEHKADDVDYKK